MILDRNAPQQRRPVGAFALSTLLVLTLMPAAPRDALAGQATSATPAVLAVMPAGTAPSLSPLAVGFADWVERRVASTGVAVVPGSSVRAALQGASNDARSSGTRELLELAAGLGASHAILVDLAFESGRIDVLLRVHQIDDGRLLGAGRAAGPASAMAASAAAALERALPLLGGARRAQALGFEIDQLALHSRALARLDRGDLAGAWHELERDPSAAGDELRAEIEAASKRVDPPREERVRLMAARGESEQAWQEILREASEQLYAAEPDPRLLRAAGEVQLGRGKLHEAQAYFARALEIEPDHVGANIGLGQALASQQDLTGARVALERAMSLDPSSPDPTRILAAMTEQNASDRARANLRAGREAGERMELRAALAHFDQAIALDPTVIGEAYERKGELQLAFGEHAGALQSYREAAGPAGASLDQRRGIARALRGLGDAAGAEKAYVGALELQRDDATTLQELGELYVDSQRAGEARPLLEQAVQLAPSNALAKRSLAHALHEQGELEAAMTLLGEADQLAGPSGSGLREAAMIQRKLGRPADAGASLERAVGLEPTSVLLRQELAALYEEQGRDPDAARQHDLVQLLGGVEALQEAHAVEVQLGQTGQSGGQQLEGLIASFGLPPAEARRATVLGARESLDWQGRLLDVAMPKRLDLTTIAADLAAAIDPLYERAATPELAGYTGELASQLFEFESERSLDAATISALNATLDVDMVFLAVVQRGSWLADPNCPDPAQLHVEVRRLSGDNAAEVGILANHACLPGAIATHARWNWYSIALWGALVSLLFFPLLRGFGKLAIHVTLPDNTRALFSISLTKRPRKVKTSREHSSEGDAMGRFNQKLRSLGRRDRRLERSKDVLFRWVPARSAEYYVTVHGPLFHSLSEQLIGDFLEERTVTVKRGDTTQIEFDLRPKDCPVEIMIYHGNNALNGAQVAVVGDRSSLCYTRNGAAFLYLPKGSHTIVAGARDRAAERTIKIASFDPIPLVIDLAAEGGLVFKGCSNAVTAFLESNYDAAANALEAADQRQLAATMRARSFEQRGDIREASRVLEEAGELTRAAELLAKHADASASASLFEEAGDFLRAAEAHRAAGDLLAAARSYEAAYDYNDAIECYRDLGAMENVLDLLEKSADHFEAGKLALELDDPARAVQNLQQVETRHAFYGDACLLLAQILAEQGNRDFAIEKFEEAQRISGIDSFSIEMLERYGTLLEQTGRVDDAINVLSAVRRQDLAFRDVNTRIEALKQQQSQLEAEARTRVAAPRVDEASAPRAQAENRYEILDQIGAGGMGVVYRAKDKHLGRQVALKRLPESLREHPAAVKFFEREARAAAVLNHPNIVTVYDAGQENGQFFITMELLEGTPLDSIVKKRGALPPLIVAQLGVQIATGLHFAHRNKIIHRDIKTANLFLTRDKIVKIMDFGLAKMVEEVRKGATVIGGTPCFMAPEQSSGGEVDHRADLYALGVTLFQLATGTLPFTDGDVSYQHRHAPPPDPRELNAEVPAAMAELILGLMQKRPEDRVQKAADVVRVLQGLVDAAAAAPK